MRLNFLGTPSITFDNKSEEELPGSTRATILLASLAFSNGALARSVLLERLWPEVLGKTPKARSDKNLDGYATEARKLLGALHKALRADKGTHTLVLYPPGSQGAPSTVKSDIFEFQQLASSHQPANIELALSLVRGQVLAPIDEGSFPWLARVRRKATKDYVQALKELYSWPSSYAESLVSEFIATPSGTLLEFARGAVNSVNEEGDQGSADFRLTDHYRPDAPNLQALTQLIIPAATPFYDADVTLELKDGRAASRYELTYGLEISASLDAFILALTSRASLTDLLLAECPDISDSFTCSTDTGRKALLDLLLKGHGSPITVHCLQSNARGISHKQAIRLIKLQGAESAAILSQLDQSSLKDVILLRGRLPGSKGSERRISYRVRDAKMNASEHYAFWIADRPTFVRRVSINARQFTPEVRVHPMIGNIAHEWDWDDQQCDTLINNWVVKNQGVFLSW